MAEVVRHFACNQQVFHHCGFEFCLRQSFGPHVRTSLWFHLAGFQAVVHDCIMKGLGMSSRVCVTGHLKVHVPLIKKSRASCRSGRFSPNFFSQKSS